MSHKAIRWYVAMNILFHRQTDIGMQETGGRFRSDVYTACDPDDTDYADLQTDINR